MSPQAYEETIRKRDEMLRERSTDSFLDRYESAVLGHMYDSLLPSAYRLNPARLFVTIDGREQLDAATMGGIMTAVQKATAKLVESRLHQGSTVTAASAGAKKRAFLRPVTVTSNQMVFDMAPPPPASDQLLQPVDTTQAELGLLDLCESLPSDTSITDEAVEHLPGAALTIRSAVRDLVRSPILDRTMRLELRSTRGDFVRSILAPDQTRRLRQTLRINLEAEVESATIDGYLDAAREVRRVFYLETMSLGSIEGSIEPNLVEEVRALAGQPVRIGVVVSKRKGRKNLHNLVSIQPTAGRREDFIRPD